MKLFRLERINIIINEEQGLYYPFRFYSNKKISEKEISYIKSNNGQPIIKLCSEGKSMEPLIKAGSMLTLKYVNIKDISSGDLITYVKNNTLITHRVILKVKGRNNKYKILEKGDNSIFSAIGEEKFLGKIIKLQYDTGNIETCNGFFNLFSKLISYNTVILYSIYFCLFYLPLLLFEFIINGFNYSRSIYSFNSKKTYKKFKKVLAKSAYFFNWIIVKFYKLFFL